MSQDHLDALIIRYLTGEATPEDRAELETWRMTAPEHQRAVAEMETLWRDARTVAARGVPSREHAWQDLAARLHLATDVPVDMSARRQRSVLTSPWLYTLVAVAAILILVFSGVFQQQEEPSVFPAPLMTITTANGQRTRALLPDGSTVQLNAASHLTYPQTFTDTTRLVALDGEAYFDVVSDGRPFIIRTAQSSIRVLGTSFNVRTRDGETRVAVKEGKVALNAPEEVQGTGVIVPASHMSVHRANAAPEPPQPVDIDRRLGWLTGALVFDQAPLSEVVEELQRHYDRSIIIIDSGLKTRHITAQFQDQSLETVLSALCVTLDARYSSEAGVYRIFR